MTQVRHRSTFLGPQHAFYQAADWPAPCRYHLQFHDMIPGDLWNAPDWAKLIQPHILLPTGFWNHWRKIEAPFFYIYQQNVERIRISVQTFPPLFHFFWLELRIGLTTFAYNSVQSPIGAFAYGGSCTLSREPT